jgi:glutamate mutase epsilon subunit
LPPGVDARYLLGIVKNIASENELHELTEALIANRLAARELALRLLEDDRRAAEELHTEPARRIAHHADRAATSERKIDRHFWLAATGDAIVGAAASDFDARADWLRFAAARINVTTALPARDREQLVRALARHVLPIV